MRQITFHRTGWLGLALCAVLLAGCGDDGGDVSVSGPAPAGVLALACPSAVTAGVKTVGFTATLIQPGGTPVAGALINVTPVPNQGSIFAPAGSTTATSGGTTDAQGQLGFGFTVPSGTASGTVFQLTASSGSQSKSCQVTVQTPSLVFAAPATDSTQSVCTPVQLSALSSAGNSRANPIASTVDVSTTGNGLLTTNAQACTGSTTLNGLRISGTTGDFEVPLYVVARTASTTTVTLTDSNDATRTASINLNFVEQPTALSLNVDTQQVNPAPAASRFATLTATVTSASGRAVASQPVAFSLTTPVGGSPVDQITPAVASTDGSGAAATRYEAGSKTGQATVRACVQNTQICDTRTVTVTTASTTPPAATPNRLTLDASPLQVSASPADARFSTLTATVYDASNGVLANQAVAFTLTKSVGGINTDRLNPPNSTTGSAGTTTSRYEAGSNAGYATVQACVQGTQICDTRSITVTASSSGSGTTTPTPSKLTLSATPQSVTTSAGTTPYSNLKAMVYDASNNGLSGQGVTFTVQLSGGGSGTVDQASATTDANGAATDRFTAGTTVGSATVKACVQNTGICDAQTITVTAGTTSTNGQVTKLDFAGTNAVYTQPSTKATSTTLTATPRDANNQPVVGQVVNFTLQSAGGNDQLSPTQATTTSSGAQTTYQAGTATGTAAVTACVQSSASGSGSFCQTLNITVSDGGTGAGTGTVPASIKFTSTTTTVKQYPSTGDTAVVTATVTDSNGKAVPSQTVTFALQNSAGGNTNPDKLISTSAQTDASGTASVTYQAGDNSGSSTATIRACVNNICTNSSGSGSDLNITTIRPNTITLTPATGTTVTAGKPITLTATVTDSTTKTAFDNQPVTFGFYYQPNGEGTLTAAQTATDANGNATVTFTPGSTSGTYQVYAQTNNYQAQVQVGYTVQ